MKFKGMFKRAKKEFDYMTLKDWDYKDAGRFWDSVKDYDEIDDETYAYKRRFYDSARISDLLKKGKVLDIDCRTGNGSVFYHRLGKVKEAVCVSPSKDFLDICGKRMKKYKIQAKTILLRKVPLELKESSFDSVLCFETMEHIAKKDHLSFLKELNRLLKKEGQMILTMPNILWEPVHWLVAIFAIHHSEGPHRFLTSARMKKLLKKAGFKIIKKETTVLIPVGPRWLTKLGEVLEGSFKHTLMPLIGLRRIYVCRKI